MNIRSRTRLQRGTSLLFAVIFVLSGCADSAFAPDPTKPSDQIAPLPKMKHSHLYGGAYAEGANAKVLERYFDLIAYNDFIVQISSVVLDMNRVIERYSSMEGVTITRCFHRTYRGFSMHVDTNALPYVLGVIEFDDEIEWLQPDARVQAKKPREGRFKGGNTQHLPWGVDRIDADLSSTRAGNGMGRIEDVDIFILDSGIKGHDVDLVNYSKDGGSDIGLAFVTRDARDNLGHGTHVSGTAAAKDNDHGVVGVAPGARVHNLKVLNDQGWTELSTVIAAVEYVTEFKIADPSRNIVVNISFGADVGTVEYNALDEAIASSIEQGVVYVVAAGNEAIDASTVTPAHVEGAITVGSYGESNRFSKFSNYGPVVDLLAPGENILSSSNATGAKQGPVLMSGTSMAAPHVAGAAALYLSSHPGASPLQVATALQSESQAWIHGMPANTTNRSIYVANF